MAFTPRTCERYIDDFPGIRAHCESMIANGKRCVGCPDHPDSPEKYITLLEAERDALRAEVEKILQNYAQLERHHNEHHDDIEVAEAWAVSTGAPASPTTTKE